MSEQSNAPDKKTRLDKIAEQKAALQAKMNELERKQKKLTMTKDETRARRSHLFIVLAGVVIAACRKDEAFKAKIVKLLEAEKASAKGSDRKEDFEELLSTFSK